MDKNNYYNIETTKVEELKHFPYETFTEFQKNVQDINIGVAMDHARNWVSRSSDSPAASRNFSSLMMMYIFLLPLFYLIYAIATLSFYPLLYLVVSLFVAITGSPMARRVGKTHYLVVGLYLLIWIFSGSFPSTVFWLPILVQYLTLNKLYKGSAKIVRKVIVVNEKILCLFWKWYDLSLTTKDGVSYSQRDVLVNGEINSYKDIQEEWKEYYEYKSKQRETQNEKQK